MQVRFIHLGGNPSPGAKVFAFLVLAFAMALVTSMVFLAFSLFLIAMPVFVLAGLGYYLYRVAAAHLGSHRKTRDDPRVIEGEYRVIHPGRARMPWHDEDKRS